MRTLSGTLEAEQQKVSGTPYIRINLPNYSGGTDLTSYLIALDHIEQTFGGSATLLFGDVASWFIVSSYPIDLKGQQVDIGYGFNVSGVGNEYSEAAPLWITNTRLISAEGVLQVQFDCIDVWQKLQLLRVIGESAGQAPRWDKDTTIYDIVDSLLTGIASLTKDSSDGIVDAYKPFYIANINDSIANIISDVMSMTNCGIRMRQDGMHIYKLPENSSGAYDYNSNHIIYSELYDDEVTIPNRVIVVDRYPSNIIIPTYIGVATDTVSYAALGDYYTRIYQEEGVTSDTEATQLAQAFLSNIMRAVSRGIVIAPMNCGQELGDVIKVDDPRW